MTEREAINYLEFDIAMTKFDPMTGNERFLSKDSEKVIEAEKNAIEALEKQDAKEPVHHDNCGNPTLFTTRCPKCFEIVEKSYLGNVSWCRHCGQKINWE